MSKRKSKEKEREKEQVQKHIETDGESDTQVRWQGIDFEFTTKNRKTHTPTEVAGGRSTSWERKDQRDTVSNDRSCQDPLLQKLVLHGEFPAGSAWVGLRSDRRDDRAKTGETREHSKKGDEMRSILPSTVSD